MVVDKSGQLRPDPQSRDRSGIIVLYNRTTDGLRATRAIRLDWGVATISAASAVDGGAGLLISGTCQGDFDSLKKIAKACVVAPRIPVHEQKLQRNPTHPPASAPAPGGAYIARLRPNGQVEWIVVFENTRLGPSQLMLDGAGNIYADVGGLYQIASRGGSTMLIDERTGTGQAGWRAVDRDGMLYFGGDRNTKTGYQPWRQPYLYQFDSAGHKQRTLYEFDPHECACGGAGNGLCSDSSIALMTFDRRGDWVMIGKSDGGNSVLGVQPDDWHKPAPQSGFGMTAAGAHVLRLSHIIRYDPKVRQVISHTVWAAYTPQFYGTESSERARRDRGRPNSAFIFHAAVLQNDSIAFVGAASTGLIQTPGALWTDPMLPDSHGGENVTVFRPDESALLYSSYLPGISGANLAPCRDGLIVVGQSAGTDGWVKPTAAPSIHGDQEFAGGSDGFVMLLEMPKP